MDEAFTQTTDYLAFTLPKTDPGSTKNREGRMVPFAALPELADALRQRRQIQVRSEKATPWVFSRNGKPILDFRGAWRKACKAAGVPDSIPHDFRRTAVRNLERAGVSRSVAMQITGHKTESIYRRYAIVSEGDISEGLKKLAKLYATDAAKRRTFTKLSRLRASQE
jgi:integrase